MRDKAGWRDDHVSRRAAAVRDTKERVLGAALEIFAERGYHAATVEEIAERAGMTKGAVYYWFRDKEDLASDLQAQLWTDIATKAQRVLDPDANAIDNLKLAFRGYLMSLDDSAQARFFLRDCWAVATLDAANREQLEMGVRLVKVFARHRDPCLELSRVVDGDAIQKAALIMRNHRLIALERALAACLALSRLALRLGEETNIHRDVRAEGKALMTSHHLLAERLADGPEEVTQVLARLGNGAFGPEQRQQVLPALRATMDAEIGQQANGFHRGEGDVTASARQTPRAEKCHTHAR